MQEEAQPRHADTFQPQDPAFPEANETQGLFNTQTSKFILAYN